MKSKGKGKATERGKYIKNLAARNIAFSKRKKSIMKKANELAQLTGGEIFLIVASEAGNVFTFSTAKLKDIVDTEEGRQILRGCIQEGEEPKHELKFDHGEQDDDDDDDDEEDDEQGDDVFEDVYDDDNKKK